VKLPVVIDVRPGYSVLTGYRAKAGEKRAKNPVGLIQTSQEAGLRSAVSAKRDVRERDGVSDAPCFEKQPVVRSSCRIARIG
jgi:hypothetical protein